MKKVLLTIVALLLLAGVVLVALAASKPNTYRVERKAVVAAPPESAYARVEDFRRWAEWSPWERLDPAMKKTYDGPESGVGASYAWSGNAQVGAGKMTITDSDPPSRLGLQLEFIKPFAAECKTQFTFAPDPAGTEVTWAMEGTNNFVSKVFAVFMDMDTMIGKDLETGLANLDTAARSNAPPPAAADSTTTTP